MRTVEDESGRRYLLLKRSAESSLVRDAETGEERYVPNDELTDFDGVDPLETAAAAVSTEVRRLVSTVHDDRGLGLLVLLAREPRPVRTLLGVTDLCESDLLGLATELRAAGLLEETTVDGERGYAATHEAVAALDALQSADEPTPTNQSAGASSSDASD